MLSCLQQIRLKAVEELYDDFPPPAIAKEIGLSNYFLRATLLITKCSPLSGIIPTAALNDCQAMVLSGVIAYHHFEFSFDNCNHLRGSFLLKQGYLSRSLIEHSFARFEAVKFQAPHIIVRADQYFNNVDLHPFRNGPMHVICIPNCIEEP